MVLDSPWPGNGRFFEQRSHSRAGNWQLFYLRISCYAFLSAIRRKKSLRKATQGAYRAFIGPLEPLSKCAAQ